MNIGVCHYRVEETDGVSLEMEKWKEVLEQEGHTVYFISGNKVKGNIIDIKELFYQHEENKKIHQNAFINLLDYSNENALKKSVLDFADKIEKRLTDIIIDYEIDLLIVNNIWSLGYSLPAGIGFFNSIIKTGTKCIAHHHDFYWERERYAKPTCPYIEYLLDKYFPPESNLIKHIVINLIAKSNLKKLKRTDSYVIPNVFDFNSRSWEIDDYNRNFKQDISLNKNDIIILQATRVAERKAIELAIDVIDELAKIIYTKTALNIRLFDKRNFIEKNKIVMVLPGLIESNKEYVVKLKEKAKGSNVELLFINNIIKHKRCCINGKKYYSLWDAYVHADIVTYPSIYEGFGNQLLEGIFAKKPMVVFEYPVYKTDIKNKSFKIISLGDKYSLSKNGLIKIKNKKIKKAASRCYKLLINNNKREVIINRNFHLANRYFSYKNLKEHLKKIIT